MSTAHINAAKGDIAETILLPEILKSEIYQETDLDVANAITR